MTVPWISMPTRPRSTLREILDVQPRYGILYLASAYVTQGFFYAINYWSLGLVFSWSSLLLGAIFISPFLGMAWLTLMGWIFQITGRWLGGSGNRIHLRSALAWSKIPLLLFLPLWAFFISLNPKEVFILGAADPSPILINVVSLLLGTWSQLLRIQSIREVQGFSFLRALGNVSMVWLLSAISFFLLFSALRFIYIIF